MFIESFCDCHTRTVFGPRYIEYDSALLEAGTRIQYYVYTAAYAYAYMVLYTAAYVFTVFALM